MSMANRVPEIDAHMRQGPWRKSRGQAWQSSACRHAYPLVLQQIIPSLSAQWVSEMRQSANVQL
jgi:hypothetical protein